MQSFILHNKHVDPARTGLVFILAITLYIDGLVHERRNSSALAMESRLSYINPPIYMYAAA